jgi:ATP-dependent Clp protease ATP-binding subunit ClpA
MVYERYTEDARKAVVYARDEALRRNETTISAADLLAGLGVEEETRADRVGALKTNASYLRWLTGLPALPQANPGMEWTNANVQAEMGMEAKRALAFAVDEADRDREYWIDTDHLLRGIMRFPNTAHFAVLKTEINLKAVRSASWRDRENFLPEQTPNMKVVQYLVRKHLALWVPPLVRLACYLYILIQGIGPELTPLMK